MTRFLGIPLLCSSNKKYCVAEPVVLLVMFFLSLKGVEKVVEINDVNRATKVTFFYILK